MAQVEVEVVEVQEEVAEQAEQAEPAEQMAIMLPHTDLAVEVPLVKLVRVLLKRVVMDIKEL